MHAAQTHARAHMHARPHAQATVLALKAILASEAALGRPGAAGEVCLEVDGAAVAARTPPPGSPPPPAPSLHTHTHAHTHPACGSLSPLNLPPYALSHPHVRACVRGRSPPHTRMRMCSPPICVCVCVCVCARLPGVPPPSLHAPHPDALSLPRSTRVRAHVETRNCTSCGRRVGFSVLASPQLWAPCTC